jgi:von Willebrand factor type A domain
MKSVCVILLDTSSSMAGGFEGEQEKRPQKYLETHTKIEAAKKWLLEELDGLPNTETVLVTFDTEPRLVLRVSASEMQRIKDFVPEILARGRKTNIAAALHEADEIHHLSKVHFKTVVLISDGLSNVGDPVAAADECRRHGIEIKTVLIEGTSEGRLLANRISGEGNVWEAASGADMRRAMREATRSPLASNLVPLIAAIVSVTGVIGTLSTLLSTGIEKAGLPEFVAGATSICFLPVLIYVWLAKEVGTPIYTTATESYTPKFYKYEELRKYAGAATLVCVSASFLFFDVGSEMRHTLQLRITNNTDYTLSAVKVELPEIDDAFDFTVKPQQSSAYHTASLKFVTCLRRRVAMQPRRMGSVAVQTDASPTQPGQIVSLENLLPNNGKYTLVVWSNLNLDGKKLIGLRLNRE